ncbi:MAG TPA: helix-turn-helix transcriptional regulator [Caulobacterales bacterium]|nr:helix-turn-helix transcriptional regulator [Caulobacterales bacterium]
MSADIDLHVGKRIRRRRRLLGLTQQRLAEAVGIRFQQIQKYECGANRVTASRLHEIGRAMNVPTTYFFEGLGEPDHARPVNDPIGDYDLAGRDLMAQKETMELIRAYYRLAERPRRKLLDLAKSLEETTAEPELVDAS